ncbi:unnamed protein product, partial [Amoebophrya sp. A25]
CVQASPFSDTAATLAVRRHPLQSRFLVPPTDDSGSPRIRLITKVTLACPEVESTV